MSDINVSKKIKSEGVNLFISYLLLIVTTIAIIIFLGCQFGCNKKEKTYSLPVNSIFYRFSGSNNDVVEGFSTNFLQASDNEQNARQYMVDNADWGVSINDTFGISMDLHGQKITGTQHAFSPITQGQDVNNIFLNFTKLDFAKTNWLWFTEDNNIGYSGFLTFYSANFSNVTTLNLHEANFVDEKIYNLIEYNSAYGTFSKSIFSKLTSLDLSSTIFNANYMATETVYSALYAFELIDFHSLMTINFGDINGPKSANERDGINKLESNTFSSVNGSWNTLAKLQIIGHSNSWNDPESINILDNWFSYNCWQFNLI